MGHLERQQHQRMAAGHQRTQRGETAAFDGSGNQDDGVAVQPMLFNRVPALVTIHVLIAAVFGALLFLPTIYAMVCGAYGGGAPNSASVAG